MTSTPLFSFAPLPPPLPTPPPKKQNKKKTKKKSIDAFFTRLVDRSDGDRGAFSSSKDPGRGGRMKNRL